MSSSWQSTATSFFDDFGPKEYAIGGVSLLIAYILLKVIHNALKSLNYLKGQHVFISGGSQGLGKALAKLLVVEYGARVTIVSRRNDVLVAACKEIEEADTAKHGGMNGKGKISYTPCDVTDFESVKRAVMVAEERFGPVDLFIACAGSAMLGMFQDMPIETFRKEMELNYIGTVLPLKFFVPGWIEARKGQVIVTSSAVGLCSFVGYSAYSPSKFALRGLAESLRNELAPYNIKVRIAYPGNMSTPGYEEEMKAKPGPTKAIEASFAPESPEHVARHLLNGVRLDQFNIYCGDLGSSLIGRSMTGISPSNSLLLDFVLTPFIQLFGIIFRAYLDYEASKKKWMRHA